MSYILDALRKSEKERQRGAVPDLMTAQEVIVQAGKKRLLWPYVVAGALMVNAGVLIWWLTGHPNRPSVTPRPPAVQQSGGKTPVRLPDVSSRQTPGTSLSPGGQGTAGSPARSPEGKSGSGEGDRTAETNASRDTAVQSQPLPAKSTLPDTGKGDRSPAADAKAARDASSVPAPSSPGMRSAVESRPADLPAPQKNRLYHLKELPLSLQQTLPDFAISTHLYSTDETSRMVRINGQMLREGQFLSAGLRLDEISADGVIFSYHGYRFRIGLK